MMGTKVTLFSTDRAGKFRRMAFLAGMLLALAWLFPNLAGWGNSTAIAQSVPTTPIQHFYIPLPESQVRTSLRVIYSSTGSTLESVTSIGVTADNTILYYDHWEDGYEADIANPTNTSTQIWGDGDPSNGDACDFVAVASLCTNDVLSAGAVIVLRNQVGLPRNPAEVRFDARDRVSATNIVSMARSLWATQPGTVLADASEVYDLSRWGTDYRLPIGEDLNSLSSNMFEYVSLLVMAAEDGTTVQIDTNGDGSNNITTTLNQGDPYQVSAATVGDLTSNARVTSDKPIQAHLITGDIGSRYESRWYTLLPTDQAGPSVSSILI